MSPPDKSTTTPRGSPRRNLHYNQHVSGPEASGLGKCPVPVDPWREGSEIGIAMRAEGNALGCPVGVPGVQVNVTH